MKNDIHIYIHNKQNTTKVGRPKLSKKQRLRALTLSLPPEYHVALKSISNASGVPVSHIVRELIKTYIDENGN